MATGKAKRKDSEDAPQKEQATANEEPSSSGEASPDAGGALPFEDVMARLSSIVTELEDGQLSLEESLTRFEEGVRLARMSQRQLDSAEAKVEELLRIDDSGPVTKELDD